MTIMRNALMLAYDDASVGSFYRNKPDPLNRFEVHAIRRFLSVRTQVLYVEQTRTTVE